MADPGSKLNIVLPSCLQSMDQVKDLKYTDQYLMRLFREADKDYKRGVDYEQLLAGGEEGEDIE